MKIYQQANTYNNQNRNNNGHGNGNGNNGNQRKPNNGNHSKKTASNFAATVEKSETTATASPTVMNITTVSGRIEAEPIFRQHCEDGRAAEEMLFLGARSPYF